MKKENNFLIVISLVLLFFLQSCIHEHSMSEEEKVAQIEKFEMFAKNKIDRQNMKLKGSDLSYQQAFRDLYYHYYSLHPEKAPDFDNESIPLPDFRLTTQLFIEPDSSKTAVFPIVENRKVVKLLVAKINRDETLLEYYYPKINKVTQPLFDAFMQKMTLDPPKEEPIREAPIQEIIITVPPKPVDFPLPQSEECDDLSDYENGGCGGPPPSTCIPYQNCSNQNQIGGLPTTPHHQDNPCETIKTVGKNQKTKLLLGDLKTKSTQTDVNGKYKETSYFLTEDSGNISEEMKEGLPGKNEIKFSMPTNMFDGYIHNHNPGALSIFSPHDLASLSLMYKSGKIKNVNTFVFGVVTTAGTQYLITIDNISAFNYFASKFVTNGKINEDYVKKIDEKYFMNGIITGNNNVNGNEAGFLNILQQMNAGVKVLKGDATFSNWSVIEKGVNDQIIPTNCN